MTPTEKFCERLTRPEIPALTGLRAIAALVVVAFHSTSTWFPGWLGVLLFFVLSGFLITWLLLKESESTGTVSLRAFYMRRSLRIFPPFYVFWILQVAMLSPVPWALVGSSAAYVSNYYNGIVLGHEAPVMSHTWSLAVEEQFYLLWPILFVWQRRSPRRLAWYLAGTILGCQVLRVVGYHAGLSGYYVGQAFEMRCDALAVGCLSAIILRTRPAIPSWFLSHGAATLSVAALVALTYVAHTQPTAGLLYCFGPAAIVSAFLIMQSVALSGAGVFSLLEHPVANYLGRISYPIYLYHFLVLNLVHSLHWPKPFRIALGVPLLILVASASYYLVERPFLKLRRRAVRDLDKRQGFDKLVRLP